MSWATYGPAVAVAFAASLVEVVEALTIVLAVMTVRGWKPAVAGTISGLIFLALLVLVFGPVLDRVPLQSRSPVASAVKFASLPVLSLV